MESIESHREKNLEKNGGIKKIWRKKGKTKRKKKDCQHPGSNWGPLACEASVITTTLC